MSAERKYTVDTNLFIRAFRDPAANTALRRFHAAFAPFEHLSAVVAMELRTGTRSAHGDWLERNVLDPFARRGRLFTPSYDAWKQAGAALADLATDGETSARDVARRFGRDVLLAASCRESDVVLVTENVRDFTRIARALPFEFLPPWPSPVP